jgi:hypothetical protein
LITAPLSRRDDPHDSYLKYTERRSSWAGAFNRIAAVPGPLSPVDHFQAHRWLRDKHGLDTLTDAVSDTRLHDAVKKILTAEASSLFGIGVKLAALPSGIHLDESRSSDPED